MGPRHVYFNKLPLYKREPQTCPQLLTLGSQSLLPPHHTPLPDAVSYELAPSDICTLLRLQGRAREGPSEFRGRYRWLVLGGAHLPGLVPLLAPSLLP